MHGLLADIRLGLRLLASRPLFASTALVTIAIGIGANAAIFSVVNGLILRPLPFAEAERLFFPLPVDSRSGFIDYPDGVLVDAWDRGVRSVESVEVLGASEATVMTSDGPRIVRAGSASHGLLGLLRLAPHLGRGFTPEDEQPGASPVVMLGYGFWQRAYGGDRAVVGRDLVINDVTHAIIGVAPRDLVSPLAREAERDVWLPQRRGPDGIYAAAVLMPITRLLEGATRASAAAEMAGVARRIAQEQRRQTEGWDVRLYQPDDLLGAPVRRSLFLLLGAVGFVLLIGCANVANLLLARAAERENELAVRAALGASRGRLLRQLLAETLLLGALGGVFGYVLAHWGLDLIVALRPESLRDLDRVRLDGRVTAFVVLATIGASLGFGVVPALRASRIALSNTLRSGSPAILGGSRARRVGATLIAAEVALSLVLLTGAGLLLRTLTMLQSRPLGYEPAGLVAVTIELPRHTWRGDQRGSFFEQLREAVASMPGVQAAHIVYGVPPGYDLASAQLRIEGTPLESEELPPWFVANYVDPEYFDALGIRVLRGRTMRPGERDVILVSESFSRRYLSVGDPVGRRIRFEDEGTWLTVVGVTADIPAFGLAMAEPVPQLHYPSASAPFGAEMLLLRTDAAVPAVREAVVATLRRLDPAVPVRTVESLPDMLQASLDGPRFNLLLLGVLAVMAVAMSAVGLHGVVSVAVGQRTREMGIRRALGESDASVTRQLLEEGMRPTLLGLGVGLIGALLVTRVMGGLLFGVSPRDPATFIGVALLLALVALVACWVPARRALRLDPLTALRAER